MNQDTAYNLCWSVREIAQKENFRTTILDPIIVNMALFDIFRERVPHEPSNEEIKAALIGISDYFNRNRISIVAGNIDWSKIPSTYYDFYKFLLEECTRTSTFTLLKMPFEFYYTSWMEEVARIFAAFCHVAILITDFLREEEEFQETNNANVNN